MNPIQLGVVAPDGSHLIGIGYQLLKQAQHTIKNVINDVFSNVCIGH